MSDEINYQALAAALVGQMGVTTKAVGSTPTSTYGHGPGGLFSSPGLSQPLDGQDGVRSWPPVIRPISCHGVAATPSRRMAMTA